MSPAPKKKKLVVLGGGVSSITSLFEITSEPDWKENWDITLYQLGWRIGGKGASGRNAAHNQRIEEHGLHVWFGFYDNSFRVMRAAYDELARKPAQPLATLEEAFTPHNLVVLQENVGGEWVPWPLNFPANNEAPGTGGLLLDPWDYLQMLLEVFADAISKSSFTPDDDSQEKSSGFKGLLEKAKDGIEKVGEVSVTAMAGLALQLARQFSHKPSPKQLKADSKGGTHAISGLLKKILEWVEKKVADSPGKVPTELRRLYVLVDLSVAIMIGIIRDYHKLHDGGFAAINDQDFKEWLASNGATQMTLDSPMTNWPIYSTFSDGQLVAAGNYLYSMLRAFFTYKGAYFYKMEAGMGDVVFGPFYEVLRNRGVKFEYFHRVDALRLSADKKSIGAIEMFRQVELKAGPGAEYHPFVNVKGLNSWPSEPNWDQIKDADKYKDINLESYSGNPYEKPLTLRQGVDYDKIIYGISAGALSTICADLINDADNPRFKTMADSVSTTATGGLQLWLSPLLTQLGWTRGTVLQETYARVYNGWLDATQVLIRECWDGLSPDQTPGTLAYFSGALTDAENPDEEAIKWLEQNIAPIWPNAVSSTNPNGLDWSLLIDPENREGIERFKAQYVAHIPNPSDRYVRLPPDNAVKRLNTNEAGYDNLLITGDWTNNPMNLGSVEGSAMAGLRTANALLGRDLDDGIVH